jgi:hypothetical protein
MMLSHQKLIQSLAVAVMLLAPTAASAQPRHPRYLHARSDLRRAYLFMRVHEEPNVERDLNIAADYVVGAIREIDNAARWDRRDIDDNPPVDTHLGRGSRFREIIRLLESARADIDREEDNPMAREWRNRAFRFIDDSIAMVRKGGYDKFRDEVGTCLHRPWVPPMAVHTLATCTPSAICAMPAPCSTGPIGAT